VAVARDLKAARRSGDAPVLERVGVVYKRPLPYLYLAGEVFGAAGIPYQTADTLPLAAEPTAAALDLILAAVEADFTRDALIALLRSPHLVFVHQDREPSRQEIGALDHELSDIRYLGDIARLEQIAAERPATAGAHRALHAVLDAAREMAPLTQPAPASIHVDRLLSFWRSHLRPVVDADPFATREQRARAAIANTLTALASVHAAHGDHEWRITDLALVVRRWIEEQTFEQESAATGIHLLDDRAARYGDFDDVRIVGVVENDWPERPRRNIFYPPGLLKSLGWPSEKDRRAAADAQFVDLLSAAARRTTVSVFTLDDDALVSPSAQLDEIPRARLTVVPRDQIENARVFADEALSLEPASTAPLSADARTWADLRISRTHLGEPQFHGSTGSTSTRMWSVSALETYLDCPFKFFAQHVLKLEEEPDDEEVMDPRRQGVFVHDVFENFFRALQDAGHRSITPDNLDEARRVFAEVVDRALDRLSDVEAALERTRLLGSPAAAGLGEAVMRMEAERPTAVVERLLEHRLDGDFIVATPNGPRVVPLRGKADRIDLLADGTFRLVDYKLGWPPDKSRALQLPVYSICAEQRLQAHEGRAWRIGEVAYVAFKGPRRVVRLFKDDADRTRVLAAAQERLVATIDAIAAGQFPPTPDDVYRCETCSYAGVCRKDYVGDV